MVRKDSPKRCNLSTMVGPLLLLVEGPDEFEFFRFLRRRPDLQIHVYEGKDQLRLELETIQLVEGFSGIEKAVIVRDADQDPQAALQSVLSQWGAAFEIDAPIASAEQWFDDPSGRPWTVWILPDPTSPGDLEELLWRAVPKSSHMTCVQDLISCLSQCDPTPFGARTKAQLYAWLATQKDPLKQLHAAFNPKNALFSPADPAFAHQATLIDGL